MSEREAYLISVMEHCVLHGEFCDTCMNVKNDYAGCRKDHEEFFEMVKTAIAQRDALRYDLNIVCGGKYVDVCAVCDHYRPQHGSEKCELKGLDCKWAWRGEKHG